MGSEHMRIMCVSVSVGLFHVQVSSITTDASKQYFCFSCLEDNEFLTFEISCLFFPQLPFHFLTLDNHTMEKKTCQRKVKEDNFYTDLHNARGVSPFR